MFFESQLVGLCFSSILTKIEDTKVVFDCGIVTIQYCVLYLSSMIYYNIHKTHKTIIYHVFTLKGIL